MTYLLRSFGFAGAVLIAAVSTVSSLAQGPQISGKPDEISTSVAEGANRCRADLKSAPQDIKVGEVEEFCNCMGMQELALSKGETTEAGKAALRPQLQQMCMNIIRRQAQSAPPSSANNPPPVPQASAPNPAPAPAPAEVRQDQPATPANPFFGLWARTQQDCAEASTKEIPDSGDFVFIGERSLFDRHSRCQILGAAAGNPERTYKLSCWVEGEEKAVKTSTKYTLVGSDGLAFKSDASRLTQLKLCSRQAPGWVLTVGKSLFKFEETGALLPAVARPVAPQAKKPLMSEMECRRHFTRISDRFRPRLGALLGQFGREPTMAGKCNAISRISALQRELITEVQKCSHVSGASGIIASARKQIADNSRIRREAGCR